MTGPVELTPEHLRQHPLPDHHGAGDKHDRGTALVVGGSVETPGALVLAGLAALRAGAGRLQVAVDAAVAPQVAAALPEARVLGLAVDEGGVACGDLGALREAVGSADAVLVGSGCMAPRTAAPLLSTVVEALAEAEGRLVIDAAALAALDRPSDQLGAVAARTLLVPNLSEAGPLADVDGEHDDDAAALAARILDRTGCTVAVRGPETWIAGLDLPPVVERSGPLGLATSGSGDVLAGLAVGFLARGAAPFDAASWAVHVHALAGLRCAEHVGPLHFLARELLDVLGPVQQQLAAP